MKKIVYRNNKMFVIDKTIIKATKNKDQICNALYADIYTEFRGANENPIYKKKTNAEKLELVNTFAYNWLVSKGLI